MQYSGTCPTRLTNKPQSANFIHQINHSRQSTPSACPHLHFWTAVFTFDPQDCDQRTFSFSSIFFSTSLSLLLSTSPLLSNPVSVCCNRQQRVPKSLRVRVLQSSHPHTASIHAPLVRLDKRSTSLAHPRCPTWRAPNHSPSSTPPTIISSTHQMPMAHAAGGSPADSVLRSPAIQAHHRSVPPLHTWAPPMGNRSG